MGHWIESILKGTIWFAAMTLCMRHLHKVRLRRPSDLRAGELRHHWSMVAPALFVLPLSVVGTIFLISLEPKAIVGQLLQCGMVLICVVFLSLSVWMIVEYRYCRYWVTDEGIKYQTYDGCEEYLKWSDVQRVSYDLFNNGFRLDGTNSEVARISAMLMGLPDFARFVLERVSPDAIEPAALPVLMATRDGNPPPLWQ